MILKRKLRRSRKWLKDENTPGPTIPVEIFHTISYGHDYNHNDPSSFAQDMTESEAAALRSKT